MAGYWLKLYTEILDDPKYFRLSDNAKLGMIELMVVAKKVDMEGEIPSIEDVAFYTRRSIEWWGPVFEELLSINYLVKNGSETIIRKFKDRQDKVPDAERMKKYREKKHKKEYVSQERYEHVTKRNGDTDTDTENKTANAVIAPLFELPEKKEKKRKSNFSENEIKLAEHISDYMGIKMPECKSSKDYASASVLWWNPVKEMLRQVDNDVGEAISISEAGIDKYRKDGITMSSPKSMLSAFKNVLVQERKNGH